MTSRMKHLALVAAALAAACATSFSRAAEWVIEPGIGARYEYNDNMFLSTQNKRGGYVASVGPGLRASRNTEVSTLSMNAGAGYNYNSVTNPKSYSNWLLGGQGRYRTELTTYSADVSLLRDNTLATELLRTGIVQERVQRNYYGLSGGVSRTLTERWSVNGSLFGSAARYDKTGSNGLSDYDSTGGQAGLLYSWSPQTTVSLTGGATRYRATTLGNEDKQYSVNVSASHTYSERLRFFAGVGTYHLNSHVENAYLCLLPVLVTSGGGASIAFQQYSPAECASAGVPLTQVRPSSDRTSTGRLYDAGLTWSVSATTTLTAFARQGFNPSGVGTLVRTTSYGATLGHQFTERLRGTLDAISAKSISQGVAPIASGTFYTLLANLSYRFAPQWTMDGGMRYMLVDYTSGSNATAKAVYVALRYDFDRIAVSR